MARERKIKKSVSVATKAMVFTLVNGGSFTASLSDIANVTDKATGLTMIERSAIHGIGQKLGDTYATFDGFDEALAGITEVWNEMKAGNWSTRAEAGPKVTLLARALAKFLDATVEDAVETIAFYKDAEDDQVDLAGQTMSGKDALKALRTHPQLVAIMADITAADAKEKAKEARKLKPTIDLGALRKTA